MKPTELTGMFGSVVRLELRPLHGETFDGTVTAGLEALLTSSPELGPTLKVGERGFRVSGQDPRARRRIEDVIKRDPPRIAWSVQTDGGPAICSAGWLQVHGFGVVRTSWNSSKLVSRTIAEARRQQTLTPQTYSILHAIDLAERIETEILPSLRSGYVVLADRYVFTALARDAARGVQRDWLWNLYGFAVRPDLSIYLRIDTALSLERIRGVGGEASEAEALASAAAAGPLASFPLFQDAVTQEYERLGSIYPLQVLEASVPIRAQQLVLRRLVGALLGIDAANANGSSQ